MEYLDGLSDAELPRFVLACDFQTFLLTDLDTGEQTAFALADLPRHVQRFGFVLGRQRRTFAEQAPVNITASNIDTLVGEPQCVMRSRSFTTSVSKVFPPIWKRRSIERPQFTATSRANKP